MEITVRQEPARIVIDHSAPRIARLMAAVICGGFAATILTYFVEALLYFRSEATAAEWRQSLQGFTLIFAAFLLFAIPTWMALFRRVFVEVDLLSRVITKVIDDRILRRRREYRADLVDRVELTPFESRSKNSVRMVYPVTLVLKTGKRVTLVTGYKGRQAKQLSELLARSLGLPHAVVEH